MNDSLCQSFHADASGLYRCTLTPGHPPWRNADGQAVGHRYEKIPGSGTWEARRAVMQEMGLTDDEIAASAALSSRQPPPEDE